jgi:catechol 2,3-dioxygenase
VSNARRLGHVVLNVASLERSVAFYSEILGLREVGRLHSTVFFSFGANHHDLAVRKVGAQAKAVRNAVGLRHVAFRIGDAVQALREFKAHLEARSIPILKVRDHRVSKSLYFRDPDGIVIEVYVDDEDARLWHEDPARVAHSAPLAL